MRLNLHGAFPVEAITIPPLSVVAYHSAPRDHHHWIVSQVMKGEVAYPVVTGLSKQDAKILATAIDLVLGRKLHFRIDTPFKWWQPHALLEHLQEVISDLVLEVMSSGVSGETKQRFVNTGELVTVLGNELLLWNIDTTTLPSFDPVTRQYGSLKPLLSRWVFTMENGELVKKTVPEVWVQEALAVTTGD